MYSSRNVINNGYLSDSELFLNRMYDSEVLF